MTHTMDETGAALVARRYTGTGEELELASRAQLRWGRDILSGATLHTAGPYTVEQAERGEAWVGWPGRGWGAILASRADGQLEWVWLE